MLRDGWIITNNPKVYLNKNISHEKLLVEEENIYAVFLKVRDLIHQGHQLQSHPLSGSLKPNENPYKTVMISRTKSSTNLEHVLIIEECIKSCEKFLGNRELPRYKTRTKEDYKYVDQTLIMSCLKS